jgi:hypothetical protein
MIFYSLFTSHIVLASTDKCAQLFNAINESICKKINRLNLTLLAGEADQTISICSSRGRNKIFLSTTLNVKNIYGNTCNETIIWGGRVSVFISAKDGELRMMV